MSAPHVRGAFPWLRSGPLWRMHSSAEGALAAYLDEHDYERIELDGRRLTSRATAHAELARLLGFPKWYGGNWDAFHDCFGDFVSGHDGERVAVVWRHVEEGAPVTTVEVGWALLHEAFEHRWSDSGRPTVWLDVFAPGEGEDFDRPAV